MLYFPVFPSEKQQQVQEIRRERKVNQLNLFECKEKATPSRRQEK